MSKHHKKCCCTPCCPRPLIKFRPRPRLAGALLAGVALALVGSKLFQTPNINSNFIDINSDCEDEDLGCDCDCNSGC